MQKKEMVSSQQITALFFSYMLGSAIINIPQPLIQAAHNSVWLSILIANGIGMLLLTCVLYLYHKNPHLDLIDYSRKILGKWISMCISLPIVILLILDFSYTIIDIGGFFTTTMMREIPPYIFHTMILLVVVLTVQAGIEVMARMFVLLLFIVIFFVVIILLLVFPYYQVGHLFPIFPDGIKPVIHGTYMTLCFPYGEVVWLSFLLPFVHNEQKNSLHKYMVSILLVHGLLLIISTLCTVMVLGSLAGTFKFSLFQLARLVTMGERITRMESFIGIALVLGSYMKATILLFILKEVIAKVLLLKDKRIIILPVTCISLLLTLTMFQSEIAFVESIFVVLPLVTTIVAILPLLFVTIVEFCKTKKIVIEDDS
ncbi:GerAB/ArcD/ProY family transporter [Bacillus cereus]|uniref:GerAB/ArcD/ProY family transporter n=1 Tax=Bacillus cereus TaxID=1396 RepID=UPI000BEDB07A|nr:endospore germination permease [Bacillus cereus]PEF61481.1 spore gernimation protein [Bacillus cereus]